MKRSLGASRHRRVRALLVLAMLFGTLTVAQITTAPPAQAAEYGVRTELVARFSSGDVAYVRSSVERNANLQGRGRARVWCENSNGAQVPCLSMHGNSVDLDYWKEGEGWKGVTWSGTYSDLYATPKNYYTPWSCGEGPDQYRSVSYAVRVQDRFGQTSGWKVTPSNTATITLC